MGQRDRMENVEPSLPASRTVRIHRRKRRTRLRIIPSIPGVLRFIADVVTKTPLVPLLIVLVILWLVSSWGIYLVEHETNDQFSTYSHTLWWSFTAMQTQGANAPGPLTNAGMAIGGIWSVFSTIAFFGVIIGTLYSYFMLPRRRPSRQLVAALQYNLEEMEKLSVDELMALKENITRLADAQMKRVKQTE